MDLPISRLFLVGGRAVMNAVRATRLHFDAKIGGIDVTVFPYGIPFIQGSPGSVALSEALRGSGRGIAHSRYAPIEGMKDWGGRIGTPEIRGEALTDLVNEVFLKRRRPVRDAPCRWVYVKPFAVAKKLTSEGEFSTVMGEGCGGVPEAADNLPVTMVDWYQARKYTSHVGGWLGTEAQHGGSAIGPPINFRQALGEAGLSVEDAVEFAEGLLPSFEGGAIPGGRYWKFFNEVGGEIIETSDDPRFLTLINGDGPVYCYRKYATQSGRASAREARIEAALDDYTGMIDDPTENPGPVPVDFMPPGPYDVNDALGNVWEWTAEPYNLRAYFETSPANPFASRHSWNRVVTGGSYSTNDYLLLAGGRNWARIGTPIRPGFRHNILGLRVFWDLEPWFLEPWMRNLERGNFDLGELLTRGLRK